MNAPIEFLPGVLVAARGREWIVLPQSTPERLRLRPLSGSDEDMAVIAPALERVPVGPATFRWPRPDQATNHDASRLLRDALQLKLRAGAGPFRCFGRIAFEPRAYQLVPLLMALKLPVVRLLIADDVGIGKTIEAGLIVRELLDRGEIARLAVLCPPHLVDQWQRELEDRFHLKAVALTAANAGRLERELPLGVKLFDHHPFVVVSLDYIKSERHRDHFLSICPECVVVDEAHTCTTGQARQQRFELLKALAGDASRHLVMLTATPHSGDDPAFYNLLALLRPEFAQLADSGLDERAPLRQQLARHLVQRRRSDIAEWHDVRLFPQRKTAEVTYRLTGGWGRFFDDVLGYCVGLAERAEAAEASSSRMLWYATLALMRCVASSPASAASALRTRLEGREGAAIEDELAARVFDGEGGTLSGDDVEPAAGVEEIAALERLIAAAEKLTGAAGDPKLAALAQHLETLLEAGFRPVVFCRYIATAHYVAAELRRRFPQATVEAITGELTPEEREERVELLGEAETPVLVATDCLSEGINLQHSFTAVVHYDLSWNPTRHEQREGRVDRFGQKAPEVRATMLYGEDNPVDGLVLKVILRKARIIRDRLGVLVPLPDDDNKLNQAMLKALLLKRSRSQVAQAAFDFGPDEPTVRAIESAWTDAWEKAAKNRTIFAQRRLRPEDVLPEWRKQFGMLGSEEDVERFVRDACARLDSPLGSWRGAWKLVTTHLPPVVRERLEGEGVAGTLRIDFRYPPAASATFVHRSHPLVAVLADALLEEALAGTSTRAARCGVIRTKAVKVVTRVALLRLRHQLIVTRGKSSRVLMAEETSAIAFRGKADPVREEGSDVSRLLSAVPSANVPADKQRAELGEALAFLAERPQVLDAHATARAATLLEDHRRVREAAESTGRYEVRPCLPVDLVGIYVLLPD